MTPTRLAEIKARLEKATPGPWRRGRHLARTLYRDLGDGHVLGMLDRGEDTEFIAHARTDVADLLEEVGRLSEPGFHEFVRLTRMFLEHYPADIFASGAMSVGSGPVFVNKLRSALEAFDAYAEEDPDHG